VPRLDLLVGPAGLGSAVSWEIDEPGFADVSTYVGDPLPCGGVPVVAPYPIVISTVARGVESLVSNEASAKPMLSRCTFQEN
jgi:hypothetical protein